MVMVISHRIRIDGEEIVVARCQAHGPPTSGDYLGVHTGLHEGRCGECERQFDEAREAFWRAPRDRWGMTAGQRDILRRAVLAALGQENIKTGPSSWEWERVVSLRQQEFGWSTPEEWVALEECSRMYLSLVELRAVHRTAPGWYRLTEWGYQAGYWAARGPL